MPRSIWGGQWGGASHHRFAALVQELGLATFPSNYDGLGLFHWQGKACSAPIASDMRQSFLFFEPDALPLDRAAIDAARHLKEEFDGLVAQVPPLAPWSQDAAELLDRQTIASWMEARSGLPIAQLPLRWLALVGGSGGFDPAESSILHLAWTQAVAPQEENPESWLVHGGMGQVPQRLAQHLGESVVQQRTPVAAISQDASGVRVQGADGHCHQAAVAIVAIPPPLRSGIRFEPDLPPEQRALLQRSPMGCMAKWLAVYPKPFCANGARTAWPLVICPGWIWSPTVRPPAAPRPFWRASWQALGPSAWASLPPPKGGPPSWRTWRPVGARKRPAPSI